MRLQPGETCVIRTRAHWILVFLRLLTAAVLIGLIAACALSVRHLRLDPEVSRLSGVVVTVLIAIFALGALIACLDWLGRVYSVTNQRLVREEGVLGKRELSVPVGRVQDTLIGRGLLGMIFGFGTVRFESAGMLGQLEFSNVPRPYDVVEIIRQLAAADRSTITTCPSCGTPAPGGQNFCPNCGTALRLKQP